MRYSPTDARATTRRRRAPWAAALLALAATAVVHAAEKEEAVERDYDPAPPAPAHQSLDEMRRKSAGCVSCHTETDSHTMHASEAVRLGCTDCHGGDAGVEKAADVALDSAEAKDLMERAHVLPRYPKSWHWPDSANPKQSYTLLNREAQEYVRFVNPGDFRAARQACGACHADIIEKSIRSLHATGAMFWAAAAYNNGILPYKRSILGEAYTPQGTGAMLEAPVEPTEEMREHGILDKIVPLPAWETVKPGDIFRVFERGGRIIPNLFPETGLPNVLGRIQTLEEPGRPDIRQSIRGPGTGARIAVPLINITKTRLNDPLLWFLGTNDQPGDYRSSGCSACHVVYANDRQPTHSGPYAEFGNMGRTQTADPTIDEDESGHPIRHRFSSAIPTSQCMICHMHQPNMFLNSYLGYTMWDYESDAPHMWPEEQRYPSHERRREVLNRNPEGAAPRGKWADVDFLKDVWKMNPELDDTQFADYHGHGWNFRAVFKKDRDGNLLDADGDIVPRDDPDKFDKAVHMKSIHAEVGMHCVDCHFEQDSHGNGHIYGEVAAAVEIACKDCHGTADAYPDLRTSGAASSVTGGTDMSVLRNPDGKLRFEWRDGELIQRSMVNPGMEWTLSLVKDSVDPDSAHYNPKSARAKLMSEDTGSQHWGPDVTAGNRAHKDEEMECYSCHTSWTTSCGGCHLPIQANEKTERHHYEGGITRNYATYNPQVARDQIFMLGKRAPYKGGKVAPVRSSSALVLSSTNANREHIYIQQAPIAASGYSSQAFNPHFPHTVRKTETKGCSDCHLSREGDNNAIMAQTLGYGTEFIDFIGRHLWVGEREHVEAVRVTEWKEPQAVKGSYLHRYAYPDWFAEHEANDRRLEVAHGHGAGTTGCLQLRGEYLYTAGGEDGFRVFDVASIDNKGFSHRIITAPFGPLGHDAHVDTENATCMALPTTQPVHPPRNQGELMRETNKEQPFHPLYNYAFVTDAEEGLILVDINTFADGEPRNNHLERALTWNEGGVLDGARYLTVGGHYLYVIADAGLVIVDIDDPLEPRHVRTVPLDDGRAVAQQFRYLFVTDAEGLKLIDITRPEAAALVPEATVPLADAHRMHLARTYAYVAAGGDGLAIVDIETPREMALVGTYDADGKLTDSHDVVVGTTNASLFAYVADGEGGVDVIQLTSPELQPNFYGFSPAPNARWIAGRETRSPALSLSHGLVRDRAVDETGGQVAVFGRRGSRPLNHQEMRELYLDDAGEPWYVEDQPPADRREEE
ncbi:LVIVD repeat protein precursor [Salinisphaera sp. PC39]|uniref:hypothetical protein n=1 Tax=Salinisphaera sp. PC39 TaxID=1304156 RepID=UPI0033416278